MTNAPAGWYPDPENAGQSRWWNGAQWTDNRSSFQSVAAPPYSAQAEDLKAPDGTPWNTPWIWLIVFLPFVSSLGLLTVDWSRMFDLSDPTGMSSMSVLASPGYLISIFGGWIAFALMVWFGYLDWRELNRRGVPRPFHWAWGFLSVVYPIGRSVVVRRRTGHGISPMWVTIALNVAFFIAMLVFVAVLMTSVFAQISTLPGYYNS